MRLSALACVALLLQMAPVTAESMLCETKQRTNKLVPQNIEFEINSRGTSVDVRDSTAEGFGRGWIAGKVTLHNNTRTSISWVLEGLPKQIDWWGSGKLLMRMSVMPDGKFRLAVAPTRAQTKNAIYQGSGTCRPAQFTP